MYLLILVQSIADGYMMPSTSDMVDDNNFIAADPTAATMAVEAAPGPGSLDRVAGSTWTAVTALLRLHLCLVLQ